MTHIDTAEMYGEAEAIVGEAMADCREEIFLVSKVVPSNATRRAWCGPARRPCAGAHGPDRVLPAALAGQPPPGGGRWRGSRICAGTARSCPGASATSTSTTSNACSPSPGPTAIACNQVYYCPTERAIEHAVLPWCTAHGVALVGYSPFGSGDFPEPASPGGQVLKGIADAHGTSPTPSCSPSCCACRTSSPSRRRCGPSARWRTRRRRRDQAQRRRDRPDREPLPARAAPAHPADAVGAAYSLMPNSFSKKFGSARCSRRRRAGASACGPASGRR